VGGDGFGRVQLPGAVRLRLKIDGDMDDWKKLYFTLEPDFLNYRHSKKEMKSLEPGVRSLLASSPV